MFLKILRFQILVLVECVEWTIWRYENIAIISKKFSKLATLIASSVDLQIFRFINHVGPTKLPLFFQTLFLITPLIEKQRLRRSAKLNFLENLLFATANLAIFVFWYFHFSDWLLVCEIVGQVFFKQKQNLKKVSFLDKLI